MSSQPVMSQPDRNQPERSQPGPGQPGPGEPASTSPLIAVDQLSALLAAPEPPVVLDVRWRLAGPPGIDSYLDGHLPTARFVDLDKELSGNAGLGGRHPLPDSARFEAAMRLAGLHANQVAVAYDDGDSTVAARLWWTLRYFGHQQVAVLDGGFRAWARAGLPLTKVVKRPPAGDFTASAGGGMPMLSDTEAGQLARSGYLLDSRVTARYTGEIEPIDRVGGHIPGAISVPTFENVGEDGRFRPQAELTERFAALGLPHDDPADGAPVIGAYCGSGVTAAHQVLALELTGRRAALYVGSWSAWSADPRRPVATGPNPG